jgi:hypothetical protein
MSDKQLFNLSLIIFTLGMIATAVLGIIEIYINEAVGEYTFYTWCVAATGFIGMLISREVRINK